MLELEFEILSDGVGVLEEVVGGDEPLVSLEVCRLLVVDGDDDLAERLDEAGERRNGEGILEPAHSVALVEEGQDVVGQRVEELDAVVGVPEVERSLRSRQDRETGRVRLRCRGVVGDADERGAHAERPCSGGCEVERDAGKRDRARDLGPLGLDRARYEREHPDQKNEHEPRGSHLSPPFTLRVLARTC